jgi:hypothetical protein
MRRVLDQIRDDWSAQDRPIRCADRPSPPNWKRWLSMGNGPERSKKNARLRVSVRLTKRDFKLADSRQEVGPLTSKRFAHRRQHRQAAGAAMEAAKVKQPGVPTAPGRSPSGRQQAGRRLIPRASPPLMAAAMQRAACTARRLTLSISVRRPRLSRCGLEPRIFRSTPCRRRSRTCRRPRRCHSG